MSCPICKQRKIAMLENIVAIDTILFPGSKPSNCLSETDLNLYKKTKNALLLNLYEIYVVLEHASDKKYKNGINDINKYSYVLGTEVFKEAQNMLYDENILKVINEGSENLNENEKNTYILKTFLETALDMLMLESAISNASPKVFKNQHTDILLKAHRSFRNDLITLAIK